MELWHPSAFRLDQGILPKESLLYLTPESAWDYAYIQNWESPQVYKLDIPEANLKRWRDSNDKFMNTVHWDYVDPLPYEDPRGVAEGTDIDPREQVRDRTRPPRPVTPEREKPRIDRFTDRNPAGPSAPANFVVDPPRAFKGPHHLNLIDMVTRFASSTNPTAARCHALAVSLDPTLRRNLR